MANPLQTFPQGPLLSFHVDPDPELDNFLVHFLSIYDNLMSHHVPSPPGYDVVMTEQVSGPKEPKILGRHMPSVPYLKEKIGAKEREGDDGRAAKENDLKHGKQEPG